MHYLIVLLQENCSCLQLFDVCRLLAVPLPRFGQFALTLDSFFCATGFDGYILGFTYFDLFRC